jgi:hypothetical protein
MNMESNSFGVDRHPDYERLMAEKQAYFDKIHQYLIETNAKPLTNEEFMRQVNEARERNRQKEEQKKRDENTDQQQTPDNAA